MGRLPEASGVPAPQFFIGRTTVWESKIGPRKIEFIYFAEPFLNQNQMGAVKSFIYNKDIFEENDFAPEKKIDELDEGITIWANVNLNGPKDEIEAIFKRIDSHPLVQ